MEVNKRIEEIVSKERLHELEGYTAMRDVVHFMKKYKEEDLTEKEAKLVLGLLGRNDMERYSDLFFNGMNLERSLYIFGAASIASGIIDLHDLEKTNLLELTVSGIQKKYNINPKNVEVQILSKEDKLKHRNRATMNFDTRDIGHRPHVESSSHYDEHACSKELDRQED